MTDTPRADEWTALEANLALIRVQLRTAEEHRWSPRREEARTWLADVACPDLLEAIEPLIAKAREAARLTEALAVAEGLAAHHRANINAACTMLAAVDRCTLYGPADRAREAIEAFRQSVNAGWGPVSVSEARTKAQVEASLTEWANQQQLMEHHGLGGYTWEYLRGLLLAAIFAPKEGQ